MLQGRSLPLKRVAGGTGSNLQKRIEAIMDNWCTPKLTFVKGGGSTAAGVLAVTIPVILGVTEAPCFGRKRTRI
jgi:hypothetical protein